MCSSCTKKNSPIKESGTVNSSNNDSKGFTWSQVQNDLLLLNAIEVENIRNGDFFLSKEEYQWKEVKLYKIGDKDIIVYIWDSSKNKGFENAKNNTCTKKWYSEGKVSCMNVGNDCDLNIVNGVIELLICCEDTAKN